MILTYIDTIYPTYTFIFKKVKFGNKSNAEGADYILQVAIQPGHGQCWVNETPGFTGDVRRGVAVQFLHFSKASLLEVLLQPQLVSYSSMRLLAVWTRLWGSVEGVGNLNHGSLEAKVWSHAVI